MFWTLDEIKYIHNITFHIMNTFTNKYKIIATIKLHTDQTQILGICGSVKNIPEANSKFE